MYDLNKAMCAADPELPAMSYISSNEESASDLFEYFSKLPYEKVDAYFLSYATDGMAYEIGVIALKDAADADACRTSLEEHLEGRVNLYKTYAPDQVDAAKAADIVENGRYIALIMCKDQKAVAEAFSAFLKEN